MPEIPVSVACLFDVSATMTDAMPLVHIDGSAFVRASRPNDQYAVIAFSDQAWMVYPATPHMETEDPSHTKSAAAANAIGRLQHGNMTNMYAAVQLANQAISTALPGQRRAYMILSDGRWNVGGDPTSVLPSDLPVYVCGLGPYKSHTMLEPLWHKNPESKYYNAPDAFDMDQVFNDIRRDALKAELLLNPAPLRMFGDDYCILEAPVSQAMEDQFTVVWSRELHYTNREPTAGTVNVFLHDPSGKKSSIEPAITGPGYAIFNIDQMRPGMWHVVSQWAGQTGTCVSLAGFEFGSSLSLQLTAPPEAEQGEPIVVRAQLTEQGSEVEDARVSATVIAPRHDVSAMLKQQAPAIDAYRKRVAFGSGAAEHNTLSRLQALRDILAPVGVDPFAVVKTQQQLVASNSGGHLLNLKATAGAGAYSVRVVADGLTPNDGTPFRRMAMTSIVVS